MTSTINFTGDTCSTRGAKDVNEDYALILPHYGACLADGIGGEQMGEAVARCACNVAMKAMSNGCSASESFAEAQTYSKELAENLGCGRSGAAFTVIRCCDDNVEVAWAGDVQCMHLSAESGQLRAITKPDRSRRGLTNALGKGETVMNTAHFKLSAGDRVLLCSDGVWEHVDSAAVEKCLASAESPLEAAVMLTMGRKSPDDATAVVLFAED